MITMMKRKNTIKVGVGAVIVERLENYKKILMIKRGNEPWKGMWSIPGGKAFLGNHSLKH